jgi:hypothetical protein
LWTTTEITQILTIHFFSKAIRGASLREMAVSPNFRHCQSIKLRGFLYISPQ